MRAGSLASKSCDYMNFCRMDPDLLPRYREVCDRFARLSKVTLSNELRRMCRVTLNEVRRESLGDLADRFRTDAFLTLFSMVERESPALLLIEQSVAYRMMTALLGGNQPGSAANRTVAAPEVEVMNVVSHALLGDLKHAWMMIADLKIKPVRSETSFEFVAMLPRSESMLRSSFEIDFDGESGQMHILVANQTIFPVRDHLV